MSNARRRVLIAALVGFGVITVTIVATWRFVAPDLHARGKAAIREGRSYAHGRDAEACLDEALRRLGSLSVLEEAENKSFLTSCLAHARATPALCEGAPSRADGPASARWASGLCAARAPDHAEPCTRLVGALHRACALK